MENQNRVAVLTTPLNARLYQEVFGPGARYFREWKESFPVASTLHNLASDGARLVVVEESHFPSARLLAQELAAYIDMPQRSMHALRMVVVCPGRRPGDALLAYLACYLGVYDIVRDCPPGQLVAAVGEVARCPCARRDVLDLMSGLADFDGPAWRALGSADEPPMVEELPVQEQQLTVTLRFELPAGAKAVVA